MAKLCNLVRIIKASSHKMNILLLMKEVTPQWKKYFLKSGIHKTEINAVFNSPKPWRVLIPSFHLLLLSFSLLPISPFLNLYEPRRFNEGTVGIMIIFRSTSSQIVKCHFLISSIFDEMNFQHFWK